MAKSQTQFFYKNFSWNLYRANFEYVRGIITAKYWYHSMHRPSLHNNSPPLLKNIKYFLRDLRVSKTPLLYSFGTSRDKFVNTTWKCMFIKTTNVHIVQCSMENSFLRKSLLFLVYSSFFCVDLCVCTHRISAKSLYEGLIAPSPICYPLKFVGFNQLSIKSWEVHPLFVKFGGLHPLSVKFRGGQSAIR